MWTHTTYDKSALPPIFLLCGNQYLNGSLIIFVWNHALSRIIVPPLARPKHCPQQALLGTRFPLFLLVTKTFCENSENVTAAECKARTVLVFKLTAEHRNFSGPEVTLDLISFWWSGPQSGGNRSMCVFGQTISHWTEDPHLMLMDFPLRLKLKDRLNYGPHLVRTWMRCVDDADCLSYWSYWMWVNLIWLNTLQLNLWML